MAHTPRPATAGRGRGPTRQRWEGEGHPALFAQIPRGIKRATMQSVAIWSRNIKKEVTGMPLTLPLLRNGPLPLPASRARGVRAALRQKVCAHKELAGASVACGDRC